MKHIAKPLEFSFASDAFNLAIEGTEDGERIQREIDAIKMAKEQADARQLSLDTVHTLGDSRDTT